MGKIIIALIWAIVKKKASSYTVIGDKMIKYDRLWKALKEKNISQYKLIKEYGISTGQLDRLRKNSNVSSYTLDKLCTILKCNLEDIAEFVDTSKI